jgi:DNA-binding IclR family transcriptional regulator
MPLVRQNADAVHHRPGEVSTEARARDLVILAALENGPATVDQLVRATRLPLAVIVGDLPFLVKEGLVARNADHSLYSLPSSGAGRF